MQILVLFIGVLVGWLTAWLFHIGILQRRRKEEGLVSADLEPQRDRDQVRIGGLQTQVRAYQDQAGELVDCQEALREAGRKLEACSEQVLSLGLELESERAQQMGRDVPAGTPVLRVRVPDQELKIGGAQPEVPEPDGLSQLDGIGPKISEILQAAGVTTFAQLAEIPLDRLRDVLDQAGPRFGLADPTTWPLQARSAASAEQDQ